MPVNYQQIRTAMQKAGKLAPDRDKELSEHREQVMNLLTHYAKDQEYLADRAQRALDLNPDLRCAFPCDETINHSFPLNNQNQAAVLWAADGSQIIPDPHLAIQFGVINVGLIRLAAGEEPRQQIESELLVADDLYTSQGYLKGEESIALQRDFNERSQLLKAAEHDEQPVITLTDGPLELFRDVKELQEYKERLEEYIAILKQMAEIQLITAGYVDKPRSDLVVRLLELTTIADKDLNKAGQLRPLIGISDAEVFSSILNPDERSAIFRLQSKSAARFSNDIAIHFFYLNVGRSGKAKIARVEIPQWVTKFPDFINLIQQHLLVQCRQMGSKSYPYILHRSHEIAMVSYEERKRLLNMLQIEYLNQGLQAGETSEKQSAKDLPGKTRYGE